MHGADDPLIPVAAGRHTAANIQGARLEIIPGWGHDLPDALLPRLVAEIADHCAAADAGARGSYLAGGRATQE
jgi:pimeloyl-ACP methyl ester carboxylesterase